MKSIVLSLFGVLALPPCLGYGEIPPLREDQLRETATHVFRGTISRIYSTRERTSADFETTWNVAEIRVDQCEKGDAERRIAYVRFWRKHYVGSSLAPPGHYGHQGIPKIGANVRAYVKQGEDGGYDVLSPNGLTVITGQEHRPSILSTRPAHDP